MRRIIRRRAPRVYLLIFSLFITVLGIGSFTAHTYAATEAETTGEQRLLTVYDLGTERGFLTEAKTVGEALERAGIELSSEDTVEPGLSEPLIAKDYSVNIYRARPVVVVDGFVRQKVMTAHQTPEQIADSAGVDLHEEDIATLHKTGDLLSDGAGLELDIDRATPVRLVLYGTDTEIRTQAATVGELLKEKKISLKDQDTLSVPESAAITPGMTVEIWRDGKQTVTSEEDVDFETEKIQDADREAGFREVKTPGEKGKRTVTYEIEMKNGQEISRKEIQSVVTKEPKKQVEIVGIKSKNVFSGDIAEAMARLRQCESGGNYANKNNSLYRGAYQFGYTTWANRDGYYDPADAPPAVQDQAALDLYNRRGWQPWPACTQKLGLQDIYR